jgi:hypothetical protein
MKFTSPPTEVNFGTRIDNYDPRETFNEFEKK